MSSPAQFTFSEREGLVLLAQASAVSACAILGVLSYIAYSAVSVIRPHPRRWRIEGPPQILFLNQLSWDLVQATGGLMNVKWAVDGSVHQGSFCTAQGAIKHLSDVGAALSTLIIAIYTLMVLCFPKAANYDIDQNSGGKGIRWILGILACVWVLTGLLVGINIAANGMYNFYGPTGFWCWILPEYSVQRTATDFAFMWITAAINIVAYVVLALYLRGYIVTTRWSIHLSRKPKQIDILGSRKQTYGLLFYPLVYIVAVLPLSIARYSTFAHHHVPYGVIIFVDIIYLLSGLFNVLLFSITRPYLLPHDPPTPDIIVEEFHPAGPAQDDGSHDGTNTDIGVYAMPRYGSPSPYCRLHPDPVGGGTEGNLRWSGTTSYEVNATGPSRESLGI